MENNVNAISFKANIRTLTKIKNKSAFTEINQLFKNSTQNNKNDVLYITDSKLGENLIQLSHIKNGEHVDIDLTDVALNDINKQIDSMGTTEFTNKLLSIYNALKLHETATLKIQKLQSEILRAKTLLSTNQRIAHAWISEGKTHISNRYAVLASKNNERIQTLSNELKKYIDNFNKKIENISKKHKELIQLKF